MAISDNLNHIREQIEAATAAAGRTPNSVRLIAVSKTKPISAVREALAAGQIDFGENRPQEMVEKQAAVPEARWHMIGTLQRNKVRHIAPFVHLIHSVDSEKLLKEIDKRAGQNERRIDGLLQLNISDETQKGGFQEAEAEAILKRIADFPSVRILGLMGMAEFTDDKAVVARQFERLAKAFTAFYALENEQVVMQELSMGMSGDFPEAIAAGATMVRIGSAIFGHR
ncbi:MAG: YggS family pyridoxal phosphate-dependent enzyme [Bacteroidota bacterium]